MTGPADAVFSATVFSWLSHTAKALFNQSNPQNPSGLRGLLLTTFYLQKLPVFCKQVKFCGTAGDTEVPSLLTTSSKNTIFPG
jgi:hypothetical protein